MHLFARLTCKKPHAEKNSVQKMYSSVAQHIQTAYDRLSDYLLKPLDLPSSPTNAKKRGANDDKHRTVV